MDFGVLLDIVHLERYLGSVGAWTRQTHIRVTSDHLNDILIKVSRVPKKISGDVEGVFQATESLRWEEASLREVPLGLEGLDLLVLLPDPVVMYTGDSVRDMFLEDDNVRVRNFTRQRRREDGGGVVVDGVEDDGR